jgi:hypothetical protein
VPRIAVLTGAPNQDIWVLRNLGFTADAIATGATSQLNDPGAPDPLATYDVVFNTANWPAGATARTRLTAFFAGHGGYLDAGSNGAAFLTNSGELTGLTAAGRAGAALCTRTTSAVRTARSSGPTRAATRRSWTRRRGSRRPLGGDRPWDEHGRHGARDGVRDEPAYRADPEREWPSISTAAYWNDQ